MSKNVNNYANKPINQVRRTDYEVTDLTQIKAWLREGEYGVLATSHNGQPYATPVNYVYIEEDRALYFHGAHVGRTRANIALNPRVSFNVAHMGALIPGERISNFGVAYHSVTVFGTAAKVEDEAKRISVLLALMEKYFPKQRVGEDYPPPAPDELIRTAIYQISIKAWSAKQQKNG
ncbi:MAG: pyridoxamine 5'-phosphate oxidase family protein [Anaerolineales bacterium]